MKNSVLPFDITEDKNITYIKSNKYKTNSISLRFIFPYSNRQRAILSILSRMLFELSSKYNTKDKMKAKRDNLYGFKSYAIVKPNNDLLIFEMNFDYIKEEYLSDISDDDYLEYIDELIKNPIFNESLFNESLLNNKQLIKRLNDDYKTFANNEFFNILSKNNNYYSSYTYNYSNDFDSITLDNIIETYRTLFNNDLYIYILGNVSSKIYNYFGNYKRKNSLFSHCLIDYGNSIENVKNTRKIGQSCVIVGYTSPYVFSNFDTMLCNFMSYTLGGFAASPMFENIREKRSLCYSIGTRYLASSGILKTTTYVDKDNIDVVIKLINENISDFVKGNITDELLLMSKKSYLNYLKGIIDNINEFAEYDIIYKLNKKRFNLNESYSLIETVTKEELIECAKKLKPYFTYVLVGDLND